MYHGLWVIHSQNGLMNSLNFVHQLFERFDSTWFLIWFGRDFGRFLGFGPVDFVHQLFERLNPRRLAVSGLLSVVIVDFTHELFEGFYAFW